MSKERIGVYVCHCGTNISAVVDVEDVSVWAGEQLEDSGVVVSREYQFMCSSLGQELIQDDIKEKGLTRVVVAACLTAVAIEASSWETAMAAHRKLQEDPDDFCGATIGELIGCYATECSDTQCDIEPSSKSRMKLKNL